jgi:uncharacterized protein
MHPIVELAKKSVETFIRENRIIDPPDNLPTEVQGKSGVFVSIKKHGELRGCIGTYSPCRDSVAMETIDNAVAASTKDPRFPPVREDELKELSYSVDVLSSPDKVKHVGELDPKKYGIIVVSGFSRGLLLPDLEGVDTVEEQIRITKMKAGILPGEETEIYRFEVKRYR